MRTLRLREIREAKLLSQEALAWKARVGRVTISRLEQERQEPTFSTVHKLARALDVRPEDLVAREEW